MLHACPRGPRYHMKRFSRWRTTLSLMKAYWPIEEAKINWLAANLDTTEKAQIAREGTAINQLHLQTSKKIATIRQLSK